MVRSVLHDEEYREEYNNSLLSVYLLDNLVEHKLQCAQPTISYPYF